MIFEVSNKDKSIDSKAQPKNIYSIFVTEDVIIPLKFTEVSEVQLSNIEFILKTLDESNFDKSTSTILEHSKNKQWHVVNGLYQTKVTLFSVNSKLYL